MAFFFPPRVKISSTGTRLLKSWKEESVFIPQRDYFGSFSLFLFHGSEGGVLCVWDWSLHVAHLGFVALKHQRRAQSQVVKLFVDRIFWNSLAQFVVSTFRAEAMD